MPSKEQGISLLKEAAENDFKAALFEIEIKSEIEIKQEVIYDPDEYQDLPTSQPIIAQVHQKDKRLFECDNCGRKYKSKAVMKDHALRHSRFRDFSCSLCGKTFKTKFDLKSHNYHVHSNLKKFECKICKRKFKSKWYLNEHELAHTVEFECGECLKIFKTSRHFKRHMERNKGSKIIQCPRCDRNFHRQGDLNSHLKQVHKSERNFECEICKKAFKSKGKVKEHQIMHSDVKSFKCGNCGIAFKRKFQLNKHSLIHRD